MTLGSLFDGIGGFPLAGLMNGITPVWSSEIEPFPLKVTAARFPDMKQLGSVTDIDGAKVEPVDIITFGSPCQDLSVAGKQLGIHDGQRSNLFFEAIRIIKEMRAEDERTGRTGERVRPRFAVWENVPGAFSSNKGEDFRAVLEAFASIREDGLAIPRPKKWNHAGCVVGHGWSVAWRVYDAQYWGVPQRRKRIYLIADLAGERAGEILFEREGVRGDPAESGAAREGTADDAAGSVGGGCWAFKERAGKPGGGKGILPAEGRAFTLSTNVDQSVCYEPICLNYQGNKGGCSTTQDGTAYSLNAMHGHDVHVVAEPAAFMGGQGAKARSIGYCDDGTSPTLKTSLCGGNAVPDVCYPINTMVCTRWNRDDNRTCFGVGEPGDPQFTITAAHGHGVCYSIEGHIIDRKSTQNGRGWADGYAHTLNATDKHGVCYRNGGYGDMVEGVGTLRANGGDVGGGYGEHRR